MKKFHISNILLGIGIGIIITSIISIIFLAGSTPDKKLSKEEVRELAEQYGLLEEPQIFDDNEKEKDENTDEKVNDNDETIDDKVTIEVSQGDSSERVAIKLEEAGLINNKSEFIDEVGRKGLETRLKIGVYEINKSAGLDEIIRILSGS